MSDWSEIRKDFPALRRYRYFYTASGGPLARPVYEKAVRYYARMMEAGDVDWDRNLERLEEVRASAAKLIGADSGEVEFMPSTAAGMNIVAGYLCGEGDVIASRLEFPDTTLPWLHRRPGSVRWVESDPAGRVPVDSYRARMDEKTAVLATSHVQFSNGFRQDLSALGRIKGNHHLVVNATQSLGAFRVDVDSWGIDALCCNSYKWLLAGYGCAVLFLRRGVFEDRPAPGVGWFAVEDREAMRNDAYRQLPGARRLGWGSPSFPVVFTLGAAIDYLLQIGTGAIEKRVLELNEHLTEGLTRAGYRILSPTDPPGSRSAQTLVALRNPAETVSELKRRDILCTEKPEGMRIATHFFVSREDIDVLVGELEQIEPAG